jgi:hypothetical protein
VRINVNRKNKLRENENKESIFEKKIPEENNISEFNSLENIT